MLEKSKFVPSHAHEKSKCMHNAKFVPNHRNVRATHVKSKFVPNCHFCGVKGHIRPNCFKLKNAQRMNLFKKKAVQNQLVKKTFFLNVVCYSCGKIGHKIDTCYLRRMNYNNFGTNLKWVPKSLLTNNEGPKKWVPKSFG